MYICFQKAKSEEHNVGDYNMFADTDPIAKSQMHPCYVPSTFNKVAIDGF